MQILQVIGENGKGTLNYDYYYTNGVIDIITDSTGNNKYTLTYDSWKKVTQCVYPDDTRLRMSYDDDKKKNRLYKIII